MHLSAVSITCTNKNEGEHFISVVETISKLMQHIYRCFSLFSNTPTPKCVILFGDNLGSDTLMMP